jgi:hypothetical protein
MAIFHSYSMLVYQRVYLSNRLSDRRFRSVAGPLEWRNLPAVAQTCHGRPPNTQWLSQWIGLRENLQETIDFPIKYGVSCKISLQPIH